MQKQLEHLRIHSFRGLRELYLEDLAPVNLLVGPNNSGKTSILEAVAAYCRPLDLRVWLDAAARREFRTWGEPYAIEWFFPHSPSSAGERPFAGETRISGSGAFPVREAGASRRRVLRVKKEKVQVDENAFEEVEEEQAGAEVRLVAQFGSGEPHQDLSRRFLLWENEPVGLWNVRRGTALPVQTITAISHRVEQLQLRQFSDAILEGYHSQALTLLREIDADIRDIFIASPKGTRPVIYLDHRQAGRAPLSAFGDGIRRILLIALTIPSVSGGVLLIDEIEASLHVSALANTFAWIVRACRDSDVQVFATTHSLEAVDAILEAAGSHPDAVVGYHLIRQGGIIQVDRLSHGLLHRLRVDRGLDVRV